MSLARKLKKEAAKRQYKEFRREWSLTVKKQSELDRQGNRFRMSERKRERHAERGNTILGNPPSFAQWWSSVKTIEQAKAASPEDVQGHIQDLEWGDE